MMGFFGRTLGQDWILTPLLMMAVTIFLQEKQVTKILSKADEGGTEGNLTYKKT